MPIDIPQSFDVYISGSDTYIVSGSVTYHSSSAKTIEVSTALSPNIFIDSAEIYDNSAKIFYHIEAESADYYYKEEYLKDINVYILINDSGSIETLKSVKDRSKIVDNYLYDSIEIPLNNRNLNILAYCGNKNVTGNQVKEAIIKDDSVVLSSYNKTTFNYLNKNKDFRILKLEKLFQRATNWRWKRRLDGSTNPFYGGLEVWTQPTTIPNNSDSTIFPWSFYSYQDDYLSSRPLNTQNTQNNQNTSGQSQVFFDSFPFFDSESGVFTYANVGNTAASPAQSYKPVNSGQNQSTQVDINTINTWQDYQAPLPEQSSDAPPNKNNFFDGFYYNLEGNETPSVFPVAGYEGIPEQNKTIANRRITSLYAKYPRPESNTEEYFGEHAVLGTQTESPYLNPDINISAVQFLSNYKEDAYTSYWINNWNNLTGENKKLNFSNLARQSLLKHLTKQNYKQDFFNDIFISHTTNKKAKLCYIFDLETFLQLNSPIYRSFSKSQYYKEIIFSGSYIKPENVTFYKKNLTLEENYQVIKNTPTLLKTDVANLSSSYMITIADDNTDLDNKNEYGVKVKINIKDFSYEVFKDYLISPLKNSKDYINSYKDKFKAIMYDSSIEDKENYIFHNIFIKELNLIEAVIENLSLIYSFYSKKHSKEDFVSLFTSILHPRTTRYELFDIILNNLDNLEAELSPLVKYISDLNFLSENPSKTYNAVFEKEFKSISLENKEIYNSINYNYEAFYGYELFSTDNLNTRKTANLNGLDLYTTEEKSSRKTLELKKYFSNMGILDSSVNVSYFSFSRVDLGDQEYDLLFTLPSTENSYYLSFYSYVKQFNESYKIKATPPDYFFYDLFDKNIYAKSVATKLNTATYSSFRSVVSDPNPDSKESSINYLNGTGLNTLSIITNPEQYLPVSPSIFQGRAVFVSGAYISNFPLTSDIIKDPVATAKIITHYNNFFEDRLIYSGSSYSLYCLDEDLVHPFFTKKLKLFNKYYIVENSAYNGRGSLTPKDYNKANSTKNPEISSFSDISGPIYFDSSETFYRPFHFNPGRGSIFSDVSWGEQWQTPEGSRFNLSPDRMYFENMPFNNSIFNPTDPAFSFNNIRQIFDNTKEESKGEKRLKFLKKINGLKEELRVNVESKLFNRTIEKSKIFITTSDI